MQLIRAHGIDDAIYWFHGSVVDASILFAFRWIVFTRFVQAHELEKCWNLRSLSRVLSIP